MSYLRLLREELMATWRGRFIRIAVATLLAGLCWLAAMAGTGNRPQEFLYPAYLLVPTLLVPMTAVSFARPRAAHFLTGVFTAPVTETGFLLARLGASIILGWILLLCTLPLLLVETRYLGFEALHWTFFAAAIIGVVHAAALGLFLGVLWPGRSIVPTMTVSVLVMLVEAIALIVLRPVYLMPEATLRDILLALLHVSGPVLVYDAMGLGSLRTTAPALAALLLSVQTALLVAGAWLVFTYAQSVEAWAVTPRRVAGIALCVALVLMPGAVGSTDYREVDEDVLDAGSNFTNLTARLTRSQTLPTPQEYPEPPVLPADQTSQAYLWLFLPTGATMQRFDRITVDLAGDRLAVSPLTWEVTDHVLPTGVVREGAPPRHYIMLPLMVGVPEPAYLRENPHHLSIEVSYVVAARTFQATGEMAVFSEVETVETQVAVFAGMPVVSILGSAGVRSWRLRR